jgi:hypothetical protein
VIAADLNPEALELGFVRTGGPGLAVVPLPGGPGLSGWLHFVRRRLQWPLALEQEGQRRRRVLG